jgi:hypothetical protein
MSSGSDSDIPKDEDKSVLSIVESSTAFLNEVVEEIQDTADFFDSIYDVGYNDDGSATEDMLSWSGALSVFYDFLEDSYQLLSGTQTPAGGTISPVSIEIFKMMQEDDVGLMLSDYRPISFLDPERVVKSIHRVKGMDLQHSTYEIGECSRVNDTSEDEQQGDILELAPTQQSSSVDGDSMGDTPEAINSQIQGEVTSSTDLISVVDSSNIEDREPDLPDYNNLVVLDSQRTVSENSLWASLLNFNNPENVEISAQQQQSDYDEYLLELEMEAEYERQQELLEKAQEMESLEIGAQGGLEVEPHVSEKIDSTEVQAQEIATEEQGQEEHIESVEQSDASPLIHRTDKKLWGDYSDDYDSDISVISEADCDDAVLTTTISKDEGIGCLCRTVNTIADVNTVISALNCDGLNFKFSESVCYIDNLKRAANFMIGAYTEVKDPERLYFCDHFYRFRHELLYYLVCCSYNLPCISSDSSFSKFGIPSDRTPDMILQPNEETLLIVEISAGTSSERMAVSKGLEEAGFESKYQKEIDLLSFSGFKCKYIPLLFNMSEITNQDYKMQMSVLDGHYHNNREASNTLEFIKNELVVLTRHLKPYLNPVSSILFVKELYIKPKHDTLAFMYNNCQPRKKLGYEEYCVSIPVYNKIVSGWDRIYSLAGRIDQDKEAKFMLVIDAVSHRFSFSAHRDGLSSQGIKELLLKGDKINLLKNTLIKSGGILRSPLDSETGVRFTEQVEVCRQEDSFDAIGVYSGHTVIDNPGSVEPDLDEYRDKLLQYFSQQYTPIDYDPEYEAKFISMIKNIDINANNLDPCKEYINPTSIKTLSDMDLSNLDIDALMAGLILKQQSLNIGVPIPLTIIKSKNPFIIPLAKINSTHYTSIKNKNSIFLQCIRDNLGPNNPYTAIILDNVLKDDFVFIRDRNVPSQQYNELIKERSLTSMRMTKISIEVAKKFKDQKIKVKDCGDEVIKAEYEGLRKEIGTLQKSINSLKKVENITNETVLIRLPTKSKNSSLSCSYAIEMQHYKSNKKRNRAQSTVEGVGYVEGIKEDYVKDKKVFDSVSDILTVSAGQNPDLFFQDVKTKDSTLLTDLKEMAVQEYNTLIDQVKNSYLGHSAAFVSRLSHSLIYYSQMSFNSSYIRVDNLGYKDVLLIVKGGKKMFKSKSSKFFRLVYPVFSECKDWYLAHGQDSSSSMLFQMDGLDYMLSPWVQWHESILNDSLSFFTRVVSFNVLNLDPKFDFSMQFHKISVNVLLSFHDKRQTEVLLSNMRYILLATLGDYSGINDIFDEFLGFNYDCFQSFIRSSILFNYPVYFKRLLSVKHTSDLKTNFSFNDFGRYSIPNIFTNQVLSNENDIALMIYSTFLMTKAPYQRPVERANNIKGMLKIHELYDSTIGLGNDPESVYNKTKVTLNDFTEEKYIEELFSNDFNFDPCYCANLGCFMDSYFQQKGYGEEFHSIWLGILNQPWDSMATSTGLRGDLDLVEDFWGQKGYFVIYKSLIKDAAYMQNVKDLLDLGLKMDDKRKMLRQLNVIYKQKLDSDQEFLIFHAVDKVQWKGGREIYVMDMYTKSVQQPIEKFMAEVCKRMDNELISIPSDKRAQVIHHSIFEKDLPTKDMLTWYLTLDCSKWAPKSNFLKFLPTILNMSVFPDSFKTHFLNYTHKLFKKRIYFNKAEVEVLMNNQQYEPICTKYLQLDPNVNGYYMLMPYSWVMGIFNYTSSFLHAANQKYCSYLLFKTSMDNYKMETALVMFAHSDDSGGRLTTKTKPLIKRALFWYEFNLKCCNHLLSKKKSVVSRIYFEILSIIYLFHKLLALLPKFLGGLRFLPTDKGPSQDMLQSYSKCIEVMVAGANFSIAYLVMKFYSYMIFRFYYNKIPTEDDFEIPVHYTGLPDSHPLMVLICGSDSDIIRILHTGGESRLKQLCKMVNYTFNKGDDIGFIKPLKFKINIRGIKDAFLNNIEAFQETMKLWSIGNVNFKTTPLNLLGFLKKLNDPGFLGSLVNESQSRRISRAYFLRSGESCISNYGNLKLEQTYDLIRLCNSYTGDDGTKAKIEELMGSEAVTLLDTQLSGISGVVEESFKVYKHVSSSFFKILSYLDYVSMQGKNLVPTLKTLKPTHVEIVKTSKVFSTNFDTSQYVSYIKNPELNWALPNPTGLFTASLEVEQLCESLGFSIDEMDPESLLRLLRVYSNKTSKSIYMYSKVPSELKSIRTYTSLLTFLSVNSFTDREVHGLVMNLSGRLNTLNYIPTNIDPELYFVNNILSLLHKLSLCCDFNFFFEMNLNSIKELNWQGGSITDFIDFITKKYTADETYGLLVPQVESLKCYLASSGFTRKFSGTVLKGANFYTFTRSQRSRSGWYGKGQILFYFQDVYYVFDLLNDSIIKMYSNKLGRLQSDHWAFIYDCFNQTGLKLKISDSVRVSKLKGRFVFGMDHSGAMSFGEKKYFSHGYEAELLHSAPSFIRNLDFYEVEQINIDSYLIESDPAIDCTKRKIYSLPVKVNEISTTARIILEKEYFEKHLLSSGIGTFEDFLLTEILTYYGSEAYIGFDEMLDNFAGSYIYKIFRRCQIESLTTIPKRLCNSLIPANETGLTRILLDYTMSTDDKVIKFMKYLTPEIMAVRSEYPEEMSLILAEQLEKFHKSIYNKGEQQEIYEDYSKLSDYQDTTELRRRIINLLKYWGYGSLVNTLEGFNYAAKDVNFNYFNLDGVNSEYKGIFSQCFKDFHNIIIECMFEHSSLYQGLDVPYKQLSKGLSLRSIIDSVNITLCSTYTNYKQLDCNIDLSILSFINCFLGFLKDDDFVDSMNSKMKENLLLSSIPVNYKNRANLVVLYNTIKLTWYRRMEFNPKLEIDYSVKVCKATRNQYNLITNVNSFIYSKELKLNPLRSNYSGFLNESVMNDINRLNSLTVDGLHIRVSSEVVEPSDVVVPITKILPFPGPLSDDVFEDENWEELLAELKMEDIDEDTVIELWEMIECKKFRPKKTRIIGQGGKRVLNLKVGWIIQPFVEGNNSCINKYRQCGENIIVLSNNYIRGFENIPNSHVRLIHLEGYSNGVKQMCLAHIMCSNEVPDQFWNEYIGGTKFVLSEDMLCNLFNDLVRCEGGGVENINNLGVKVATEFLETLAESESKEKSQAEASSSTTVEEKPKLNLETYRDHVKQIIDDLVESNVIPRRMKWRLLDKYCKSDLCKVFDLDSLFGSLIAEEELLKVNSDIKGGALLGINESDMVKIFKAPEHFGMAHAVNRPGNDTITNKKVSAELNSLYNGLSTKVGADNLYISKGMSLIFKSNFSLWKNTLKSNKQKTENKRFLITLILSIHNSAKIVDKTNDDEMWQILINKTTVYFAEYEEEDDDGEEFLLSISSLPSSRLIYKPVGM